MLPESFRRVPSMGFSAAFSSVGGNLPSCGIGMKADAPDIEQKPKTPTRNACTIVLIGFLLVQFRFPLYFQMSLKFCKVDEPPFNVGMNELHAQALTNTDPLEALHQFAFARRSKNSNPRSFLASTYANSVERLVVLF
jgi:hypothetical protein